MNMVSHCLVHQFILASIGLLALQKMHFPDMQLYKSLIKSQKYHCFTSVDEQSRF